MKQWIVSEFVCQSVGGEGEQTEGREVGQGSVGVE